VCGDEAFVAVIGRVSCSQRDDQLEVSLVGVRLALLAHVVRRRLAEVQSTHGQLDL